MRITKRKRDPQKLTLQEIGLLGYICAYLDNNGVFQQTDSLTADETLSTRQTINRVVHSLVSKEAVSVVQQTYRGDDGWWVPPVLKPNPNPSPQMCFWVRINPSPPVGVVTQLSSGRVENKGKPSPNGALEAMSIMPAGKDVCNALPNNNAGMLAGHNAQRLGQASQTVSCPCGRPVDPKFSASIHDTLPDFLPDEEWCGDTLCAHSEYAARNQVMRLEEQEAKAAQSIERGTDVQC